MTPERLKSLRKKLKMTQSEMSEKFGVSLVQYQRYEHGKSNIRETIKILAEIFERELESGEA